MVAEQEPTHIHMNRTVQTPKRPFLSAAQVNVRRSAVFGDFYTGISAVVCVVELLGGCEYMCRADYYSQMLAYSVHTHEVCISI